MSKNRWAWFRRTLFGYTIMFVSVDYENIVRHRPFRAPEMKSTRITKQPKMRGKKFEMIIYDELSSHPFITGENL